MTENDPGRSPRRSSRKSPNTKFWLIAKHEKGSIEVFTLDPDGRSRKGTLPVFSFEKEATTFLRFGVPANAGWRVREITIGELIMVLLSLNARRVALDPLPVDLGGEAMIGLVSLDRARFLRSLASEHELWTPPRFVDGRVGADGAGSCLHGGVCSGVNPLGQTMRPRNRHREVCEGV